jgi:hypothetical protein
LFWHARLLYVALVPGQRLLLTVLLCLNFQLQVEPATAPIDPESGLQSQTLSVVLKYSSELLKQSQAIPDIRSYPTTATAVQLSSTKDSHH